MENKKSIVKIYSFTYGVGIYTTILCLAGIFFSFGAFFLPNAEGIAVIVVGLGFVMYSFYLIHCKYLNYITLTDTKVSASKQTFSWDEVFITMSHYFIHKSIRREDYYIFFDDHYLSEEEIYSRSIKKNAFYLMVTPKRLDVIMQRYNKKIKLLSRCGVDRQHLYDKVCEHNQRFNIQE